jgi:hypothetical protein
VEPGKASCSGDQEKQALQSAAGDNKTVSGPSIREVRKNGENSATGCLHHVAVGLFHLKNYNMF